MDWKKRYEIAARGTEEIITNERLKELCKKREAIAYLGVEPSRSGANLGPHIGHLIPSLKLLDLERAGFKTKYLLADLHAHLNEKGEEEEIKRTGENYAKLLSGLGMKRTQIIWGSKFQLEKDYFITFLRAVQELTLAKASKSMDMIAKAEVAPKLSSAVYAVMQAIDIMSLDCDIAIGGIDQRKVHVMAIEILRKVGYERGVDRSPVAIHTPLIVGLDGEKMSSSKGNTINVEDHPEVIRNKIRNAFCPEKLVDNNPIMDLALHIVLRDKDLLYIRRLSRFGGPIEVSKEELISKYRAGEIHPLDFKNAVAEEIIDFLKPLREVFREGDDGKG